MNPIPRFRFWSRSKNNARLCKMKTSFTCEIGCGDGTRVICLFARVIQQLDFWTYKSQANVDDCYYVWRRAECASLGPGLNTKPALTDSKIWPRRGRAEALHVFFFSNQAFEPPRRLPTTTVATAAAAAATAAVYSRVICSDKRSALAALLSLVYRSEPAFNDSYSMSAERRDDWVRASWLYSSSNASIVTRTCV